MIYFWSARKERGREKLETTTNNDAHQQTLKKTQLSRLLQCDEELALIPKMAAWKPWDVKKGHTVELRIEKPVEG